MMWTISKAQLFVNFKTLRLYLGIGLGVIRELPRLVLFARERCQVDLYLNI